MDLSNLKVKIYTYSWCGYSIEAKKILEEQGLLYQEIELTENPDKKEEMINLSGRKTVPQVFINDCHIGGLEDLKNYLSLNLF